MTGLRILRAGGDATIQDAGRAGWLRYGVTPAGPMDWIAHETANRLAGNAPGAAAIETGPGGIAVAAEGAPLRLGWAAAGFAVTLDDAPLPARAAATLEPGATLRIRAVAGGVWAYLAVAGGLRLAPVMGSLATHLRSAIGPFGGRALCAGDLLPCAPGAVAPPLALSGAPGSAPPPGAVRVLWGPQDDAFTDAARAAFAGEPYVLSARSDRMGYRLCGPRLAHARGHDIVSDGIPLGAVQVPGDGQPIVLMADRQPTGGYPKIAVVIRADLPILAQTRPGAAVRFRPVDRATAVAALRAARAALAALSPRPVGAALDLAALASGDHASGFVDARAPD